MSCTAQKRTIYCRQGFVIPTVKRGMYPWNAVRHKSLYDERGEHCRNSRFCWGRKSQAVRLARPRTTSVLTPELQPCPAVPERPPWGQSGHSVLLTRRTPSQRRTPPSPRGQCQRQAARCTLPEQYPHVCSVFCQESFSALDFRHLAQCGPEQKRGLGNISNLTSTSWGFLSS